MGNLLAFCHVARGRKRALCAPIGLFGVLFYLLNDHVTGIAPVGLANYSQKRKSATASDGSCLLEFSRDRAPIVTGRGKKFRSRSSPIYDSWCLVFYHAYAYLIMPPARKQVVSKRAAFGVGVCTVKVKFTTLGVWCFSTCMCHQK